MKPVAVIVGFAKIISLLTGGTVASATMKMIASATGVSKATVSRAFHAPHLVDPKTRLKIMQVAEQYNYVYNAAAGDLSRKKSSLIGVLVPGPNKSFFGTSLIAMQDKAQEEGFSLVIGNTKYDCRIEKKIVEQFQEHRVAGLILTGFLKSNEVYFYNLVRKDIPCVFTWETMADQGLNYVGFDNYDAAFRITDYLVGLKHRRIGLLVGPYSKISRAASRLEGYRAALKKNGIDFDPQLVKEREPSHIEGKEAVKEFLKIKNRPTAIFAASDTLAIGAITGLKEKGLKVPEDISIAGFDDIEFAAFCDPPLTTIRVPSYEMGKLTMKVLIEMIRGASSQIRQYDLSTDLIIRNSCAELQR
ncbi:MAG: LacI family transcriptional regulator [Desulfocapsa sp.]|nr:LacI family transcriptional regulator [Desulfocapsa sp.]